MLVVWGQKAVSHVFIYKISKMSNTTTSFKEKTMKDRHLIAKTTRKQVASKAASK